MIPLILALEFVPASGSAITFNYPADTPLASGTYELVGMIIAFDTGSLRGEFAGLAAHITSTTVT